MKITSFLAWCVYFLAFYLESLHAQPAETLWATSFGSYYIKWNTDMKVNPETGEVLITGYFTDILDMDPSSHEDKITSTGSGDAFVAKYGSEGQLIWAFAIGGQGEDLGLGIVWDASNNGDFYLTGRFQLDVDFDPSSSDSVVLHSKGEEDLFIAKYNADGELIWARSGGGLERENPIQIIALNDVDGGVAVVGHFESSFVFDTSGVYEIVSNGSRDVFIVRITSDGHVRWVRGFGDEEANFGTSIASDPITNNIVVTGSFNAITDFDPGPDTVALAPTAPEQLFILKLNEDGNLIWVKSIEAYRGEVVVDEAGNENIILIGTYQNQADLNPDPLLVTTADAIEQDVFLMRLTAEGELLWLNTFVGPGSDNYHGILSDPSGNGDVMASFSVADGVTLTPSGHPLAVNGETDFVIVDFNASGNLKWHKQVGGTDVESLFGLSMDQERHLYISGNYFSDTLSFDSVSIFQFTTDNIFINDIFLAKSSPVLITAVEENISKDFKLYPNPVHGVVTIQWESNGSPWKFNMTNPLGQIVETRKGHGILHKDEKIEIETSALIPGHYVIQLSQGSEHTTKIIIIQ